VGRVWVWDLPTRLFHWLLVVCVAGSVVTGLLGGNLMAWHGRLGIAVVGLLVFRVAWGFLGSTHARFDDFFPTPARLRAYLRGTWQGSGHNPLGALSVFALLFLLAWQAGSGLFSNDDIAFDGPLVDLVDKATSDGLAGLHRQGLWWVVGLVTLHVGAVAFYRLVRGRDLVGPMVRGWKPGEPERPLDGGRWPALIVALALAGLAAWGAAGGFITEPPPPPPQSLPAW
jgi:cytochrome b